jgi:hypothetical protein
LSAQISAADRPNFEGDDMYKGKPEEYVAAGLSYLAYSGPYYVDEANRIVEYEMAVSLFPNWKGQRQARIVKLDKDNTVRYPQKYPHQRFAGKHGCNRIKHLRWRTFGGLGLNRTATRTPESKWQTRVQLPACEGRSKL